VVGDREEGEGRVAVRSHDEGDLGGLPLDEFIARVDDEVSSG
jgi:threonyl-tRNA synthetase